MGSTSQAVMPGETVRSILTRSYEGDPLACSACAWHEAAHPRVTGSEYDAIYGPRSADNPRPDPHAFLPFVPTYRVLDYSMVALSEVYMAVETIGTGEVWAGVAIVHMTRGGSETYPEVTYKDMSESMGPGIDRCPARILDALTPTTDTDAIEWRARCRARLARPKVAPGSRVRFARPMTFTNGDAGDLFELVKGSTFRRLDADGYRYSTLYKITSWRESAHTIEA